MMKKWMAVLAVTLVLAACHDKPKDEDVGNQNMTNMEDSAPVVSEPLNQSQVPTNATVAEKKAPAPDVSDEQQIQDDADASGMTSRLPDEGEAPVPASERVTNTVSPAASNASVPH